MVTYHQQLISSDRLPNVRRGKVSSLGEQQRSLDKVQKYLDAPVEQDNLALTDAKAHHEWLMRIWNKIKFLVFFVPFPLVCLGRLVVAQAIQDNAFDAGFVHAEDFLTKPVLGDVDYIELKWKDEMLERPVFNLSYAQFNDIWHRACLVTDLRVEPRLYAMRVGAGARPDKDPLFSNALRNYILSHTGPVFDLQYQTSRIREDLMKAATAEWAKFEARKDATTLRAAINAARQEKNLKLFERLKSRFGYLRRSWGSLKLADNRRKYFEEADRSRAQGQQPPQSQEKVSNTTANIRASRSNAQMAD
ncbi:hypothetical protein DV736_g5468, partial [Chaetothyriales sp. CBS 134916]